MKMKSFKEVTSDYIADMQESACKTESPPENRGGHNRLLKNPFIVDAAYSYVQLRINKRNPVSVTSLRHYLEVIVRLVADCTGTDLGPDFFIKKKLVYDLKNYMELKLKKIGKYHPDVLRKSFVDEYTAVRAGINENFAASQVLVTDEIGIHWNVRPLRSLSPIWAQPTCVGKTQMIKTTFGVTIQHDMTHDSFVAITLCIRSGPFRSKVFSGFDGTRDTNWGQAV